MGIDHQNFAEQNILVAKIVTTRKFSIVKIVATQKFEMPKLANPFSIIESTTTNVFFGH